MEIIKIQSENPKADQWKMLSQFSYPPNIDRYAKEKGVTPSIETINYIVGCLKQSEAYFQAADNSPLDISPLLLYYGATNLLAGSAALLTGNKLLLGHHGLYFHIPTKVNPMIGDYEISPTRPADGALERFSHVFSNGESIINSGMWSLREVFGSIPDLMAEFRSCYSPLLPFCLPVETQNEKVKEISFSYDRIEMKVLSEYGNGKEYDTLLKIANLQNCYLKPIINLPDPHANLYYKRIYVDSSIYSIFGNRYLPLNHEKNGKPFCPSQLIFMFMGLYALGYLSRYYPEKWNPFVKLDETGERQVIEKFMSICQRYFPNLILNQVRGSKIQFVYGG